MTKKTPKISICIPTHNMENAAFFLGRLMQSLEVQTFKDFEIVITKDGLMAENTNSSIKKAQGEFVKILYMDDFLVDSYALEHMLEEIGDSNWLIAGADNNPNPYWTTDIHTGNNKLGSPSALMMRREKALLFDEELSWLLDVDLYKRLYTRYGPPKILTGRHVGIGIHPGQMTNLLTNQDKTKEYYYLNEKYGT